MPLSDYTRTDKNLLLSKNKMLICLSISIPGVVDINLDPVPVRVVKNNESINWNGYTWSAAEFEINEILETSKGEVPRVSIQVSNKNRQFERYLQDYDLYIKQNGYQKIAVELFVVNTGNVDINGDLKTDYEVYYKLELTQPKSNDKFVTFELGATNPYTHRFPLTRLLKNQGKVIDFGDWECGYANIHNTISGTHSIGVSDVDIVSNTLIPPEGVCFMVATDSTVYTVSSGSTLINLVFTPISAKEWVDGLQITFMCDKSLSNCIAYNNDLRYCGFPGIGQEGITL